MHPKLDQDYQKEISDFTNFQLVCLNVSYCGQ
jgi:hypothetical protein